MLRTGLGQYVNSEEFADVKFIVEGRAIYGHKVILSLLSERFRAMFSDGFIESSKKEVTIHDYSYEVFSMMIAYLYTGEVPELDLGPSSPPGGFGL
ncbi:unnamed protein product, partial [Heterosigma akashiwo]